jgi:hypothetical protein
MELKKYKIRYYEDALRTIEAEKEEITIETVQELLQHAHVIAVEVIEDNVKPEKLAKVVEETGVKEVVKKTDKKVKE